MSYGSSGLGMKRSVQKSLGYVLITLIILLSVEIGSYVFCQTLVPDFLLFRPPQVDRETFETYRKIRDPALGWPTRAALNSDMYDASGARPTPAFPEAGGECVTLYGDSFVYSEEVSHGEAWGNVLASRLGCRVGNFGVPAYGTDQAFLRFEGNSLDHAPTTILGIFPHDVLRNITQYLYLLNMKSSLAFKPRFVIDRGELRLILLPDLAYQQLELLGDEIDRVLSYEGLMPGNGIGPVPNGFPYTLSFWNLLEHERIRNWIRELPSWQSVMRMDHGSQALSITLGIVRKFEAQCQIRAKYCGVLLFPTPSSYNAYVKSGHLAFKSLSLQLDELNISYLDLTLYFAKNLGGRSYCEILVKPESCDGHLNAEGNMMVARAVEEYIATGELSERAHQKRRAKVDKRR